MTFRFPLLPRFACVAAAAAALLVSPVVQGQAQKESFTGFAINMNSGPSTATVDITTVFNGLARGNYVATVSAVWSGGVSRSATVSVTR